MRKTISIIVLLVVIISITSCNKTSETPKGISLSSQAEEYISEIITSETLLKPEHLISHTPNSIVKLNDDLYFKFAIAVIDDKYVGKNISDLSFLDIEPKIPAKITWHKNNLLRIDPTDRLSSEVKYKITIDLQKLFPSLLKDGNKIDPFVFDFITEEKILVTSKITQKNYDEKDPAKILFEGLVSFNEKTTMEQLKRALSVKYENKNIDFTIQNIENNYRFSWKTDILERDISATKYLDIVYNGKMLEIKNDYIDKRIVSPIPEFKIMSVTTDADGKKSIEIVFSDNIDKSQELSGLIRTNPTVKNLTLKKYNNSIFLKGNFDLGEKYTITVDKGVRSIWGTSIEELENHIIEFQYLKPKMEFLSDGIFLPSTNNKKVRFKAINIKNVTLTLSKVFDSNIGAFLHDQQLANKKKNNRRYYYYSSYYNLNRTGIQVYSKKVELKGEKFKNNWYQYEVDLTKAFEDQVKNENGLFILKLSFEKKDMIYPGIVENDKNRYRYDSNDPRSYRYIRQFGNISKKIILSDIGLTYKKLKNENNENVHLIYTTNLLTTKPVVGVTINLVTNQNQILSTGITDENGKFEVEEKYNKNLQDREGIFFIEAYDKNKKSRTVLDPRTMRWNLSTFDVGGSKVENNGIKAFIYQERGVYRPGDPINFSIIARNKNNTFPEDHNVSMTIYDPKNKKVKEVSKNNAADGFFFFNFKTGDDDITGNWKAVFEIGPKRISHYFKVETVVPYRLKLDLKTDKEEIEAGDKYLKIDLTSKYLVGTPSKNHKAKIEAVISSVNLQFNKKYKDFNFNNSNKKFNKITETVFEGKLDNKGFISKNYKLPNFHNVSSGLNLSLKAKVFEKGGRAVVNTKQLKINTYENFVGVKLAEMRYSYAVIGEKMPIDVILVDKKGEAVIGKELKYKIYHLKKWWWWDYNSYDQYKRKYKSDISTKLISEGIISSSQTPSSIDFTPELRGVYLIEVEDKSVQGNRGHSSARFFNASNWGSSVSSSNSEFLLQLKTDKKTYNPGDIAEINFPKPYAGHALVTIVKQDKIIDEYRLSFEDDNEETCRIKIAITKEMLPNVYAEVAIYQPHNQTTNDRPIRMYGVVPLMVEEGSTKQDIEIKTVESFKSGEKFSIEVQTLDKKKTQFTIAIVDEGLLDLTGFDTPDAHKSMYKKQLYSVLTYDTFNHILKAFKGDVANSFAIGGGYAMEAEKMMRKKKSMEESGKKRFKPVCLYNKPTFTDNNGYKKIDFIMPEYTGSVRVMVIAADRGIYGNAEKAVPVKTDLLVETPFPRTLHPDDDFSVPITVTAMNNDIKKGNLEVSIEGPVKLLSKNLVNLDFSQDTEQTVIVKFKSKLEVGQATITLKASGNEFVNKKNIHIMVNPASTLIKESFTKKIDAGGTHSFVVPDKGLVGTNKAKIVISSRANLKIENRLDWLIRYPYGCIEQTTSAAFPQLFLKEILGKTSQRSKKIDNNIEMAINRIVRFQLSNGSFSYWPGRSSISQWGTNYAGHFLIEARNNGYTVPAFLYDAWISYQYNSAMSTEGGLKNRVYKVYLLALAKNPHLGAMNLLWENELKNMDSTERWMLATAYSIAGYQNITDTILLTCDTSVERYKSWGNTYGSQNRDKGIILYCASILKNFDKTEKLFDEIVEILSDNDRWLSTQETAYMLLGTLRYIDLITKDNDKKLTGNVILPNGKKVEFDTKEMFVSIPIEQGFGKDVKINIDSDISYKYIYSTLEWQGIPIKGDTKTSHKKIQHSVTYYSESGGSVNPANMKQGDTFWIRITTNATKKSIWNKRLTELALVYSLPSCWEIDNLRLTGEKNPEWMKKFNLNREKYKDIRDDKVMWFFDQGRSRYDFVVKVTVVTKGKFFQPPSVFEAMYDNSYYSIISGSEVEVR